MNRRLFFKTLAMRARAVVAAPLLSQIPTPKPEPEPRISIRFVSGPVTRMDCLYGFARAKSI